MVKIRIKKKDLTVLTHLRNNARENLTTLSRKTKVPVSTIFDKLTNNTKNIIDKHVTLINFSNLGFKSRALIILDIDKKEKERFSEYLLQNPYVNSVCKVNNGFDFIIEAGFRDMIETEEFLEYIEKEFNVKKKRVHYIIKDLKKEGFLADLNDIPRLFPKLRG